MAATALRRLLYPEFSIEVVESEEIGIIGVGEATIPPFRAHNALLGVDEREFVQGTQATFKLGIEFRDWGRPGESYIHGFGKLGLDLDGQPFHLYWTRAMQKGMAKDIGRYSFNVQAARQGRFMATPEDAPKNTPLEEIVYAYHFDATLYARYLRRFAETHGVRRIEGRVVDVRLHPETGFVDTLVLQDGRAVRGISSSTARAFAVCSSSSACTRATRTGRIGCPAIAHGRWRARTLYRPRRIRAPQRAPQVGNGASPCSIA